MGNLINTIIALLILIIVSAVCSTFFYKKGQEQGWELAQQLVPLEKASKLGRHQTTIDHLHSHLLLLRLQFVCRYREI